MCALRIYVLDKKTAVKSQVWNRTPNLDARKHSSTYMQIVM